MPLPYSWFDIPETIEIEKPLIQRLCLKWTHQESNLKPTV
jgi:hypothetical protein